MEWRRPRVSGHVVLLLVGLLHFATSVKGVQQSTNPRIIEHPEDQFVAKNEPATLNCKAEGNPPPVITWYRNGEPVSTANENPSSHRMLLPSGQLFFLRIIHNKNNKPDVGIYYCKASNSETGASVVSRNATVDIAVLRDDFREQPTDKAVGIGDTATLVCRSPRGVPEPRIKWKKDGQQIHPHARITVNEEGSLIIEDARKDDSGLYMCIAYNIAGSKDSNTAHLNVKEKPKFLRSPQDVLVEEGNDVEFHCEAMGDPMPTIIWKREEGSIPQGRSSTLEDRSLRIERARIADEGLYICRAENSVGYVEALARLTVHSKPTFFVTPSDKVVGVGRTVSLRCEVTGNPPPAVFWNKDTSQILMFPRQDHGRFSVTDEGTLIIEPVRKEDAGEYVCQALSVAGSAFAMAKITVKDVDPRPPPIIHQGPQNQTLPIDSVAMLQCHSSGDPPPTIHWLKNNRPLLDRDPRIAILDSGTLQISDLHQSDTGIYTCKALSETGETTWSAALNVESSSNTRVVFHRTPEPSTFPGAPSKPVVSDITETSMQLTWKASSNHGASPVSSYMVEYFSHETGEGWVVASDSINGQSYVVHNLRPDTSYMFLVRARNTHGISLPSQVAESFRTAGGTHSKPKMGDFDIGLVTEKLQGQVVNMKTPEVLNPTAVKINWEILKSHRFIEGFHIKYRVMPDISEHLTTPENQRKRHLEYTIETVDSGTATMYVLRNLRSFTWYEIKVQPFYLTVEGQDSQVKRVRTLEAQPSAPPQHISGLLLNNSTLRLSWQPPPSDHHNGPLIGYKIFCIGNETRFDRNITVNATTQTILIHRMVKGMNYRIQIAAKNRKGIGIRSDPYVIGPDTAQGYVQHWSKAPWFIATTIGVIGAALWFCLCIFIIWLCRKKTARKKMNKSAVTMVPVHKADDHSRLGSYFNSLNAPNYLQKDLSNHVDNLAPDVGTLPERTKEDQLQENLYNTPHIQPPPMKTFYNKSALPVAPYATTTLLAGTGNNHLNKSESAFRPIQTQPYTIQQGNDCQNDSNSDNSRPNTEYLNDPYTYDNPYEGTPVHSDHYGSNYGDDGNRYGPKHPVLFLPPPPEHPPPSDIGTPPDSPINSRNGSVCYAMPHTRRPVHYATDQGTPMRDVLQGSGFIPPIYSDSEHQPGKINRCFSPPRSLNDHPNDGGIPKGMVPPNRPPSPKCRTMSPRTHADMRAYSPRAMSEPERGPTPPVRAYKLIPLKGHPEYPRHYSDTEGAPVPPLRMMSHNPPSPAPDDPLLDPMDGRDSPLDPMMDRAIQSSLPSLASECLGRMDPNDRGPERNLGHGHGSTEAVAPDYEEHSDLENQLDPRSRSPTSSVGDPEMEGNVNEAGQDLLEVLQQHPELLYKYLHMMHKDNPDQEAGQALWEVLQQHPELLYKHPHLMHKDNPDPGSMMGQWASVTDNSDTNCSSNRSRSSSSDDSFFAEADFASAVAMAAELSGLTVVGSTVTDPNAGRERERQRVRKPAKHRERAKRPTSPYSTDSNYSTVQVPHKPYPKSERKKQLQEHGHGGHKYRGNGNPAQERRGKPMMKAKPPFHNDLPSYNKPTFPSPSGGDPHNSNNNKMGRNAASTPKTPTKTPTTPNGFIDHRNTGGLRLNPLTSAFDTTDTPIV